MIIACFAVFFVSCLDSNAVVPCLLRPSMSVFCLSPFIPMSDQIELLATSSASSIRIVFGAHTLPFPWLRLPSSPSSTLACLPSVREPAPEETDGALVGGDEKPCVGDGTGHGRLQPPGTMQPQ